jgi:hypothetical protein
MIKECILAGTGIQFDMKYLRDDLDFDFHDLVTEMDGKNMNIDDLGEAYRRIEEYAYESYEQAYPQTAISPQTHSHGFRWYIRDIVDSIFDQLLLVWFWWILEIIPMLSTYQDPQGNWIRLRM